MNLVEARKLSGLSLQQVADRYNVSKSSVYLWERMEREKGESQPIANLIAMDLVRQSFPTKIDWYTSLPKIRPIEKRLTVSCSIRLTS